MVLRGFDADIVGRQTEATRRADPTNRFRNLAIRDTGRGILWKSRGKLDVSDTTTSDVAKNSISLAPTFAPGVGGSLLKFNLGSIIFFPVPTNDGDWGTGIIASAFGSGRSLVTLADNEIKNVEHSFITNLGSDVIFTSNELVCRQQFDLAAGSFLGFGFSFSDGGNPLQCSDECPAQLGLPPASFRECKVVPFLDTPPSSPDPV